VIFSNVPSDSEVCIFTIEAPKDLHVELTCDSPTATANGQDAADFRGEGPVVIEFRPTAEQPQLSCRAGLEEAHMEPITNNDIDIDDFDYACNKPPKDKERRRAILAANEQKIRELNSNSSSTWTAGVTCMSDLTDEELEMTRTGRAPPPPQDEMDRRSEKAERELLAPLRSSRMTLPASVDLTTDGRISGPKEQGSCGSCSVFAAVSTIESCMHEATRVLPTDLSEQQMMDCAYGVGGRGCDGGSADRYIEWMYTDHNGGLANEAQYPYRGYTYGTEMCRNVANAHHGALVTGHRESWTPTEEDIMRLLSEGHSVSAGMYAPPGSFHSYKKGIYESPRCKNCRNPDGSAGLCHQTHDITLVGYGEENGVKFWKVKNSWGLDWGEGGFGRILRNGKGYCGLGIDFSLPLCTRSDEVQTARPTVAPSCGETLEGATSGIIASPGFPTAYRNNLDCTWTIRPAAGNKAVKFTFETFELERSTDCRFDYVRFLEIDGRRISKICGDTIPDPVFYTRGNGARIKFHSDDSTTNKGFKMNYEIVENPSCQGAEVHTAAGAAVIITSPNFPSNYPVNIDCDWTILVPAGQKVSLVFTKFDTEAGGWDPVKIYDGGKYGSKLIKEFSGSSTPAEVTSTRNKLHVTFKSDNDRTRAGFRAVVSGVRGAE